MEAAFRQAQRGGAQIAVAPEGALDGYVVNETIAGKVPAERMKDVAVPIDRLAREDARRIAFGRLHAASVALLGVAGLSAGAALFFTIRALTASAVRQGTSHPVHER